MTILKKTHSENKLYPNTFYRTGNCPVDHTKCGLELTLFDFEGHHTLSSMAQKIQSAENFDKKCKENLKKSMIKEKKKEDILNGGHLWKIKRMV